MRRPSGFLGCRSSLVRGKSFLLADANQVQKLVALFGSGAQDGVSPTARLFDEVLSLRAGALPCSAELSGGVAGLFLDGNPRALDASEFSLSSLKRGEQILALLLGGPKDLGALRGGLGND